MNLVSSKLIDNTITVSVVNNYNENDYSHYYKTFDLKKPVENVRLIGVESNDQFAIKIECKEYIDLSFALYLDGVSVSQKNGIKSLSEIKEDQRNDYNKHNQFICRGKGNFFINRYNQISDKNRKFVFTTLPNSGINEILISDNSKLNRIEIYFWQEEEEELNLPNSVDYMPGPILKSKSPKIGAGEETNQKFGQSSGLNNPEYLGKIMFIYVDEKVLKGPCKLSKDGEFDFYDPMDHVPES